MKIYVGNMPFTMNEEQLRNLFAVYGEVSSVNVVTDRETGRPRGFAFVEMIDDGESRKAMADLATKEIDGRTLKINEARPRENRNGGRRRGGEGRW